MQTMFVEDAATYAQVSVAEPGPRGSPRSLSRRATEEEDEEQGGRNWMRRGPLLLAASLALATTCAAVYWHVSGRDATVLSSPSQVSSPNLQDSSGAPRLLESDELAELVTQHTMRFHSDAGLPLHELSQEQGDDLKRQLLDHARQSAQAIGEHVMKHDAEAGRALMDLQLTPEQWSHARAILDALHDKRVQEVGREIAQTTDQAADGESARNAVEAKLTANQDQMRQLADELIPSGARDVPSLPNGQRHWEVLVGSNGEITGDGPVGDWHASMKVFPSEQATERRLAAATATKTSVPEWYVTSLKGLLVTIGTLTAGLLGLISTLMTTILGPYGAKVVYWVQAAVTVADCGAQLGLSLGIAELRQWYQWLPCIISSFFVGIESIWTFTK